MDMEIHPGTLDYIVDIILAYPLKDTKTYEDCFTKVRAIEEKTRKKVNVWQKENIIDPSILEKKIKQYKTTDILEAYNNIRYLPYDVAWYLDVNGLKKGKLTDYFAKLKIFCDVAKVHLNKLLEIKKLIEEYPEEAKQVGFEWE